MNTLSEAEGRWVQRVIGVPDHPPGRGRLALADSRRRARPQSEQSAAPNPLLAAATADEWIALASELGADISGLRLDQEDKLSQPAGVWLEQAAALGVDVADLKPRGD